MIADTQTFCFSERTLARSRRLLLAVFAMIALAMAAFACLLGLKARELLLVAAVVAVPLALTAVLARFMFRQLRRLTLSISPAGLERGTGKMPQTIAWNEISKMQVRRHPNGEPRSIQLILAAGRPVMLYGFEPMSQVLHALQRAMPETVAVESKQERVDWENPVTLCTVIAALAIGMYALRLAAGAMVFDNLLAAFNLVVFTCWLAYRPVSRVYPNLRQVEVITAAIMILCGSVRVWMQMAGVFGWHS